MHIKVFKEAALFNARLILTFSELESLLGVFLPREESLSKLELSMVVLIHR